MKPENGNRLKLQTAVSRARMMLKQNLEWLPGFVMLPQSDKCNTTEASAAGWFYFANDRSIKEKKISREDIRVAESTVKKLVYRFPRALPELVASVDEWQSRMNYVLTICKSWVHDGQAPKFECVLESDAMPRRWVNRMTSAMKANPKLTPLLQSLGYLELTGLETPSIRSIQWVEENAWPLSKLCSSNQWDSKQSISMLCLIWRARLLLSPGLLNNLAELFSNTNAYHCPTAKKAFQRIDGYKAQLKAINKKKQQQHETSQGRTPKAPSVRQVIGKNVHDLFVLTLGLKQKQQQKIFQLLDLWLTSGFVLSIADFKQQLDAYEKRWLRLLNQAETQQFLPPVFDETLSILKTETDSLEHNSKPVIEAISQFCSCLKKVSPKYHFRQMQDFHWHAILIQLPENLRIRMFVRWCDYAERDLTRCDDLIFTLGHLATLLKKHKPSKSLIAHWESLLGDYDDDFVTNACDSFPDDRKVLSGTIRLLGRIMAPHPANISTSILESISSFFAGAKDIDVAERMLREMGGVEELYVASEEVKLAILFSSSISDSCEILKVIADKYEFMESLKGLAPLAEHPGLKSAIAQLVRSKQLGKLENLHWICLVLKHFGFIDECLNQMTNSCSFNENSDHSWIANYPEAFQEPLSRLASHSNSAEKIADRILGKDIPNRTALKNEKRSVESKLAAIADLDSELAVRLAGRLNNINSYLHKADNVSPRRAKNLIDKLEARVLYEIVDQFVCNGSEIAKQHFRGSPNAEVVLEKLLQPKYGRLLAEILQLTPDNQKLGLRLLFESEAGTTDCFNSEPANVRFLESMEAAGVELVPWVQSESWEEQTKTGQPYTLEFTNEIFDYLLMGFHFDTCLSPGETNFFSTIANAVDINKKVLYGKTADGNVIGRCLFVLNNRFRILTFQRYQHDASFQFDDAVNRYAKALSEKMNTKLGSEGPVQNLVASQWYDDGAVAGEPGYFNVGGDIDRAIEAARQGEKLNAILAMTSRSELVSQLRQILYLASNTNCKQFKQNLLHELALEPKLSTRHRIELATFASEQDLKPFIKQILGGQKTKPLFRFLKQDYCCDYCSQFNTCGSYQSVFGMLLELNASICLRAIRCTRRSAICSDEKETNECRRRFLALAHRRLGRTALADRLSKGQ